MGLKAETYYELRCDKCDVQFEFWDGMVASRHADQILQLAVDAEWF